MFKENGCTPLLWPSKSYALHGSDQFPTQIFCGLVSTPVADNDWTAEALDYPAFLQSHLGGPWLAAHLWRKTSPWTLLCSPRATRAPFLQRLPTNPTHSAAAAYSRRNPGWKPCPYHSFVLLKKSPAALEFLAPCKFISKYRKFSSWDFCTWTVI